MKIAYRFSFHHTYKTRFPVETWNQLVVRHQVVPKSPTYSTDAFGMVLESELVKSKRAEKTWIEHLVCFCF